MPTSQRLSYSLNHAGLHPLAASGGQQAGAAAEAWGTREGPAGLAGSTHTIHPRALSSLKVTSETPEKTNTNNSAKVRSSASLVSWMPASLEGKTQHTYSIAPFKFSVKDKKIDLTSGLKI